MMTSGYRAPATAPRRTSGTLPPPMRKKGDRPGRAGRHVRGGPEQHQQVPGGVQQCPPRGAARRPQDGAADQGKRTRWRIRRRQFPRTPPPGRSPSRWTARTRRSSDKDRRRADYSGKKPFTFANVLTGTRKRILWIGEKAPGMLTRIVSKYDTPEPDSPALYADKGCRAYPDTIPAPPYGSRPNAAPTSTGRPGGRQEWSLPSTRRSTARGWSSGTPSG